MNDGATAHLACPICDGSGLAGRRLTPPTWFAPAEHAAETCPDCAGSGRAPCDTAGCPHRAAVTLGGLPYCLGCASEPWPGEAITAIVADLGPRMLRARRAAALPRLDVRVSMRRGVYPLPGNDREVRA